YQSLVVLAGLHLVGIDDASDALEGVIALVERPDAQVLPFLTGRDGIAWLERADSGAWPHVIVCDVAGGDDDGYQVMRRIRQIEAERGMPLETRAPAVALTGLAHAADRLRAMMAGFQVHLEKPVAPQRLVSILQTLAARNVHPVETAPVLPMAGPT